LYAYDELFCLVNFVADPRLDDLPRDFFMFYYFITLCLYRLLGDLFALVHSPAVVGTEREGGEYCIRSDLVVWDLAIEPIRNCGAHIPPK